MHVYAREANMLMDWWGIGVSSATNDITAPIIGPGPLATNVTSDAAQIFFVTNEPADAMITYWTGVLTNTTTSEALETVHVVPLTGLNSDSLYTYKLVTMDVWNNSSTNETATFTTNPNRRIIIQGRVNISF
jgi:hypothetical protein